jgi:outer membrane usher protein
MLAKVLRPALLEAVKGQEAQDEPWVSVAELGALGIQAVYSAQRIALDLEIPVASRATQSLSLYGVSEEFEGQEEDMVRPQAWSILANARWSGSRQSGDGSVVQQSRLFGDAALRLGGWVLESVGSIDTGPSAAGWQRYATRLTRDWPDAATRFTAGDVTSAVRSGLPALSMAGLRLGRRFELLPTLNTQPLPAHVVELPLGGAVDVEVNGFVVRTLRLGPGVYNLREIPVFTGANDVTLRVVEPGGRVTEQVIPYFFDTAGLAPGLTEWDVAMGVPAATNGGSRTYLHAQRTGSAWLRHGVASTLTLGGGFQWRTRPAGRAWVAMGEASWVTPVGTLATWLARSQQPWGGGSAASVQWRINTAARRGADWGGSLSAQVSRSGSAYAPSNVDAPAAGATEAALRAGAVWAGGWGATLSLARRAADVASASGSSLSFSLRRRLGRHWSLEGSLSRQRTGAAAPELAATLFLRYGGDASPDGTVLRGAAGYQSAARQSVVQVEGSGITTVAGGEAPWRLVGASSRSAVVDQTSLDSEIYTGRGEARATLIHARRPLGSSQQLEVSVASSLVISKAGVHLGAPVADSAAVLVPRKGMEGLKLLVDPQRERAAASSDALGAPVLTDLVAYSARVIQLDAQNLPPGRSLGVDRPVLLPAYRSVLEVPVGSNAVTQIKGSLVDAVANRPMVLQALRLQRSDAKGEVVEMFTNRRGEFRSPPLPPGRYLLTRPGEPEVLKTLSIGPDEAGMVDLGQLPVLQRQPGCCAFGLLFGWVSGCFAVGRCWPARWRRPRVGQWAITLLRRRVYRRNRLPFAWSAARTVLRRCRSSGKGSLEKWRLQALAPIRCGFCCR